MWQRHLRSHTCEAPPAQLESISTITTQNGGRVEGEDPVAPRGRRAAGPQGPQGAPGVGIQFGKALPTNAAPQVVFEGSGIRIEFGCTGGAIALTLRATAGDHNVIEVTAFNNAEGLWYGGTFPDYAVNLPVDLLASGSGLGDYNGLVGVRTLGGEVVTAQWFAMGSSFTSQGDCVVGGTVSP